LLVSEFVKHIIQRYGLQEVRNWYFEVWNEPNLSAFWSGTKDEYFQLYKTSAIAIKRIDMQLRVGGPATSKASWIEDLINFCANNKIPLDFVSTHLYPQDEQVQYPDRKNSPYKVGEFFSATVKDVEEMVRKSVMPNLEIHWTEWNTQTAQNAKGITWGDNIYVDNLYAASFIVRNCLELDKYCNSLSYWVVSDVFDEGGIPNAPFSCTYGLKTVHGIPKASYNAFKFLRRMEGNILAVHSATVLKDGTGIAAVKETDVVKILLWNQNFAEIVDNKIWSPVLDVSSLLERNVKYQIVKAVIGEGHGSAWESWLQMGKPLNLSPTQEELLRAHSQPEYEVSKVAESGQISQVLKPGEVVYLELYPLRKSSQQKFADPTAFEAWNKGMGERSK